MNKIEYFFKQIFDKECIVFWYGGKEVVEMEFEFNVVVLFEVNKIKVEYDEFWIKYLVFRKVFKEKFLFFFFYVCLENEYNWFLDFCLANYVFIMDVLVMYLQELGLDMVFKLLVFKYIVFFQAKDWWVVLQWLI